MKRLVAALGATCVILSWSQPARANGAGRDVFDLDLRIDLPITVATGATGSVMFALREQFVERRCAPACDATQVNKLDRLTMGKYRPLPATAGDIAVALNLALPYAFQLGYQRHQQAPWRQFFEDALLVTQSLTINMGIHQLVSLSVQRPRPLAYDANLPPELAKSADAHISFYSGHTANSFAAATSASFVFGQRYPHSAWRWPFAVGSHGLAAMVGYLRIASGHHYISDVLIGALVGSSIGLVVPALHLRKGVQRMQGLGEVKLVPVAFSRGAGLGLRWSN